MSRLPSRSRSLLPSLLMAIGLTVSLAAFASAEEKLHLDVHLPAAGETVGGQASLIEVAGRISGDQRAALDVVVALDVSGSMLRPSGVDLDADGHLGRPRRRSHSSSGSSIRSTDSDDAVFQVCRTSALRVLESLKSERMRVGVVTFAKHAKVLMQLGPPQRAQELIASIQLPAYPDQTNLERAILVGEAVLRRQHRRGHKQLLLIVSDGRAEHPMSEGAASRVALHAARRAAGHGVSIYTLALGPWAAGPQSDYAELAEVSSGAYAGPHEVSDLIGKLHVATAAPSLARLQIANLTTREPAASLRVFYDGRFQGFVRLSPGINQLSVQAVGVDGAHLEELRNVHFDPLHAPVGVVGAPEEAEDPVKHLEIDIER